MINKFTKTSAEKFIQRLSDGQVAKLGHLNKLIDAFTKAYLNFFDILGTKVTTISGINEWTILETGATVGFSNDHITVSPVGKVTNIGEKRLFKIDVVISVSSGNNNVLHVAFFKNNVIVPSSEQDVVTNAGGKATSFPMQCVVELLPSDYLEIKIKNATATNNILLTHLNVILTEL
jgi:hypothetical protein